MSTESTDSLAPAGDPDGVRDALQQDTAQELRPIVMWGKENNDDPENVFDFRPVMVEEEETEQDESPDPKASSAAGSALAANYEMFKTPDVGSLQSQENSASADKGSTPPNPNENGTPTSSPKTSDGKTEAPV